MTDNQSQNASYLDSESEILANMNATLRRLMFAVEAQNAFFKRIADALEAGK